MKIRVKNIHDIDSWTKVITSDAMFSFLTKRFGQVAVFDEEKGIIMK